MSANASVIAKFLQYERTSKRWLQSEFGLQKAEAASEFNFVNGQLTSKGSLAAVIVDNPRQAYQPPGSAESTDDNSTFYYIYETLGGGAFGTVYEAFESKELTKKRIVKMFSRQPGQSAVKDTEREYLVSVLIKRRLGDSFCRRRISCASNRFYTTSKNTGFIVFPFAAKRNLETYLLRVLYPEMRRWRVDVRKLARTVGKTPTKNQLQTLSDEGNDDATKLLVRLDTLQIVGMTLSLQIAKTVGLLHSKRIYHKDLKPENVIVEGGMKPEDFVEFRARVIDFGLACVTDVLADKQIAKKQRVFLECPARQEGTIEYDDPLADTVKVGSTVQGSKIDADQLFGKNDTYAVAKIIQNIFDAPLDGRESTRIGYPVVRPTPFMPNGLIDLLRSMTGENKYKPSNWPYDGAPEDFKFNLSSRALEARKQSFMKRPTMGEAVLQLVDVILQWKRGL